MKVFGATLLSAAILLTITGTAPGSEFTKGVVKKIDTKGKKITIIHEELKALGMPAMTMVFFTADDSMLDTVEEGKTVEFLADRIDGKLTVMEIRDEVQ